MLRNVPEGCQEAVSGWSGREKESQLRRPNGDLALWAQGDTKIVGEGETGALMLLPQGGRGSPVSGWHQSYLAASDRCDLSKTYTKTGNALLCFKRVVTHYLLCIEDSHSLKCL